MGHSLAFTSPTNFPAGEIGLAAGALIFDNVKMDVAIPRAIHWFRQDLRLKDNPALYEAAREGSVLPIYIFDPKADSHEGPGAASRVWLHHSLASLNQSVGGALSFYRGSPIRIIRTLCRHYRITKVCWTRCYQPKQVADDTTLKAQLKADNIQVESRNGSLLWEPWTVAKHDGSPYKIFTPFYLRGCLSQPPVRAPLSLPEGLSFFHDSVHSLPLSALALLPKHSWHRQVASHWQFGEQAAQQQLQNFLEHRLCYYPEGRDFPDRPHVSRLSPHIHFGEISPHSIWSALTQSEPQEAAAHFCRQLAWREFSHHLLFYHPTLPAINLRRRFDAFPWSEDHQHLFAWQRGETGFPLVDAGMKELWQTGYMHNRVRMVSASLLVKNLLLDWRAGARWFWDCLFDADLANNSASWQWVAGCGSDAAPYFRIFNPVTQGKTFDPNGHYIKRFLPELRRLPEKYLFSPWKAPASVLQAAGVQLGKNYPLPLVDLQASRQRALQAFASLPPV